MYKRQVLTTREYSPDQLRGFDDYEPPAHALPARDASAPLRASGQGTLWLAIGAILAGIVFAMQLDKQLFILAGLLAAYGIALLAAGSARADGMFGSIVRDVHGMPPAMRRLAVTQFFSWFALFAMWIYTTGAVTSVHYATTDTASAAYNEGANWVGVLFAAYNGFAALWAIAIPRLVAALGLRRTHLLNCVIGGLGLLSIFVIREPKLLLLSMVGVGIAWASILSIPYALLSDSVPAAKMGTYMGIFNFFIVIPQLVAASLLGFLLKTFFGEQPISALVIGGISMIIAGLTVLRVPEPHPQGATA